MFARVARPVYRTATRFTSTTTSNRALSSRSIDKKPEINGDSFSLVSRNEVMKGSRHVSTSPLPLPSEIKAPNPSGSFFAVRIPPPAVDPEPPIRVPYVPDSWDSAKPIRDPPLTEVPKVVVVGGTETSHGSAHPHTLEDIHVPLESDSTQVSQKPERSDSILDDIAEDLHLPPIQEIKTSFRKIFS